MLHKLSILVLALSLGTVATTSDWLLLAPVGIEQSAQTTDTSDEPAPKQFFESLQIILVQSGGLQWQQALPEAQYAVGYSLAKLQHFSLDDLRPDAVIQLNRILFTHIMPSLAP